MTAYRRQSIQATTPSRIGFPRRESRCAVLPNLLASLDANWRQRVSCRDDRMLTQNDSHWRSFAQLFESRAGKNATRGGRNDTEVKDPTIIAIGSPCGPTDVTTQTPVGYCARTWRYHFGSMTSTALSDMITEISRASAPTKRASVSPRRRAPLRACRRSPRIALSLRSGSSAPRPMDNLGDRARRL